MEDERDTFECHCVIYQSLYHTQSKMLSCLNAILVVANVTDTLHHTVLIADLNMLFAHSNRTAGYTMKCYSHLLY